MLRTPGLRKSPTNGDSYMVDFGGEMTFSSPHKLTLEQQRKLYRKLDFRLLPILTLMFLLCTMDRGMPFYVFCYRPDYNSLRKHRERQN